MLGAAGAVAALMSSCVVWATEIASTFEIQIFF